MSISACLNTPCSRDSTNSSKYLLYNINLRFSFFKLFCFVWMFETSRPHLISSIFYSIRSRIECSLSQICPTILLDRCSMLRSLDWECVAKLPFYWLPFSFRNLSSLCCGLAKSFVLWACYIDLFFVKFLPESREAFDDMFSWLGWCAFSTGWISTLLFSIDLDITELRSEEWPRRFWMFDAAFYNNLLWVLISQLCCVDRPLIEFF